MTDADYNLTLLANTPAQAKSLLYSLEQVASGISFLVNTNKTKFMHFKQEGTNYILNDQPLKFVDQFTYLKNNISSMESKSAYA